MIMENKDILYLNAGCGFVIISSLSLQINSIWLAGNFFALGMVLLLGEYYLERYKLTKTKYRPLTRSQQYIDFDRKLRVGLFLLNLVAIFIVWFPPPFPTDPIDVLWPLFLYFGFIMALLTSSLRTLGREVARSKYIETES